MNDRSDQQLQRDYLEHRSKTAFGENGKIRLWMTGHVGLPISPKRGTFTGMSAIKELEQAVLALPAEQRVHLAESLLESLSPPTTVWSEAEELAEVERRERQMQSGEVQPISETDFWKRIDARRKQ